MQSSTRLALAAALSCAIAPCLAAAQGDKPNQPANQPEPKPYLLALTVKESSSGKAVQEKSYTLVVIADDTIYRHQNLRDGDRIPYLGKDGQNYQDVGTNIDAQEVARRGDALAVTIQIDSTSLSGNSKLQSRQSTSNQPVARSYSRHPPSRETNRDLFGSGWHLQPQSRNHSHSHATQRKVSVC